MNLWNTAKADHVGARADQQDRVEVFSDHEHGEYLILVSDGVGGHAGGALASQSVVNVARLLWDSRTGSTELRSFLYDLCRKSHDEINRIGVQESVAPRATIAAVFVRREKVGWVHSGDSRVYHFIGKECRGRTRDHSVLQMLVEQKQVKEEDMGTHPDQGVLLQSLGGKDFSEPTIAVKDVASGESYLVCTDGFWERIKREEAGKVVTAGANLQQKLAEAVYEAARRGREKSDNVAAAALAPVTQTIANKLNSPWVLLGAGVAAIVVLVIGLAVLFATNGFSGSSKSETHKSVENPAPPPPQRTPTEGHIATPDPEASNAIGVAVASEKQKEERRKIEEDRQKMAEERRKMEADKKKLADEQKEAEEKRLAAEAEAKRVADAAAAEAEKKKGAEESARKMEEYQRKEREKTLTQAEREMRLRYLATLDDSRPLTLTPRETPRRLNDPNSCSDPKQDGQNRDREAGGKGRTANPKWTPTPSPTPAKWWNPFHL